MFSNRLAFVALGFACLAAAGGGGYLATRQNLTERASPTAAAFEASQPVQETQVGGSAQRAEVEPGAAPVLPAPLAAPAKPAAAPRPAAPSQPSPSKANNPATTTARNSQLPALTESGPPAPPEQAPQTAAPQEPSAPVARQEEAQPELVRAPEPEPVPERTFDELVVAADSVVGLQMESSLTSERARIEDRVEARVIRDVRVSGQVAIPSGSRAIGSVTAVDRGGKFKERARIGIRFTTLILADGTTLPITTETIYRYGEAPGNASAAKIGGGAVGGAILGAILGGAKGAAIGAAAGAGGGAATVQAGERNAATFPNGTQVTARFLSPVAVTVER